MPISNDREIPTDNLNGMKQEVRRKILIEWNQTQRDYPRDKSLHQLFEEQVQRTPNAIAIEFGGQVLTYDELNGRANQLAHFLRAQGAGPDVLVGICAVRSLEMVVGILGIIKAGAAYVPIDPEYPAERVAYMVADAGVPVLLTQHHLADSLPTHSASVFRLDSDWELVASLSRDNPCVEITALNLAYMIYTSGSTGKPKGAMNTHRGIVNRLFWGQEQYQLTPTDVVLQKTPFSFDISVWEFFWPLLNGARLSVAKPGGHREADYLVNYIQSHGITVAHFVPSMLDVFLGEPGVELCTSLRHVICSGEALTANLRDRFFARLNVPLHNLYGPTEAAVEVTHWTCTPNDTLSFVPIGRPVANTRCYILGDALEPLPIGTPGELYLGGVQVGRGYHRQPELTSAKFVPDPFQSEPEARLYKTGDLCRFLPDGNIQYLGRIDNQVKIRGNRIELEEIESVLLRHTDVRQVVVVAREDRPGDKRLVAYVVTSWEEPQRLTGELREYLHDKLPDYMIPSAFVKIEDVPKTANGKIDKRALPIPDYDRYDGQQTFVAPSTPLEEMLAEAWRNVLGIERIGVHDNFFDFGGHSLLATRLVSQVRSRFGFELTIRSVFEYPTIQGMVQVIDSSRRTGSSTEQQISLSPVLRTGQLPLSFAQERLWFLDRYKQNSATYNVPWGWRLCGPISHIVLESCLQELVRRHESLRTTFHASDEGPWQQVHSHHEFSLPLIDLRPDLPDQRAKKAQQLFAEMADQPFNLDHDLMLRAALIQLADDEHWLVANMHHIASDGWSVTVFERELSALYQAFRSEKPSPLLALPIQYADYAVWQRNALQAITLDSQLFYWKQQLAQIPTLLELPTDYPRPAVQSLCGARQRIHLDAELTRKLTELSRHENVTLFMTLLASWQVLLSRYSGQTDIVVGAPIAGRQHTELEGLIGFFVNTLPLRASLENNPTFRDLLQQIRETTLSAYAHQEIPFEKLVQELKPPRSLSHSPLFQVMFVLQSATGAIPEIPGLSIHRLEAETTSAKFDLTLSLAETTDGLQGSLEYDATLFNAETISRMIDHYETLLRGIIASPNSNIDALPLLGVGERQQLLVDWNQTERQYPRDIPVHRLFERQVRETPDAIAVEFADESLSYDRLNARANQLARHLQKHGVGTETRVGICVDRSFDMIIGLLAILKAGGAYVPLDPHYPDERLSFLVADTNIALVLTQQHLASRWQAFNKLLVSLDDTSTDWSTESPEDLPGHDCADHLAYVIYTSGSSGIPKGVEVLHRGIARLVCNPDYVRLDRTQSLLQLAVLSFDASTFEIWGPLLNGGRCVLAPAQLPDAAELQRLIQQKHIRTLWLTSTLFNTVVDGQVEALAGIEQLLVGGEALSVTHIQKAQLALGPHTQIINGYGPTESTTFACCHRLPETIPEGYASIPIGRPISNTTAYVLDTRGEPVPIGVAGELYLGGDGVARGYLNQPALTAEKFLLDPFSLTPGARMYRTGDTVRWLADGTIEFLGRRDQQVKLRGFRIELGEIENALLRNPAVSQAVVVMREDRQGDKQLVAYVVPAQSTAFTSSPQPCGETSSERIFSALPNHSSPSSETTTISARDLRQSLVDLLPTYMIPSSFIILPKLPTTANGKVDKQALPSPEIDRPHLHQEFVGPRTLLERHLVDVWSSLLRHQPIGIYDNFFELGGHSLLVLRLIDTLNRSQERKLKVRDVFSRPTIAELARLLTDTSSNLREKDGETQRTYLESIRTGHQSTHIVIVGATVQAPLQDLPERIPVWWLKLDGLHVLPHLDLDIRTQATEYVKELTEAIPRGKILLCGHSYGGLLAIEVANQLNRNYQVELVLLEPTPVWQPPESFTRRLTQHTRSFRKPNQGGRVQHFLKSVSDKIAGKILKRFAPRRHDHRKTRETYDQFRKMVPHFRRHIRSYKFPQPFTHNVHLIGTPDYLKASVHTLKCLTSGAVTALDVPASFSHLDVALPENNQFWVSVMNRLIHENESPSSRR